MTKMSLLFRAIFLICITFSAVQGQVDTMAAHAQWLTGMEGLRQEKFEVSYHHLRAAAGSFRLQNHAVRALQCDLARAELLSRFGKYESSSLLVDSIFGKTQEISEQGKKISLRLEASLLACENEEGDSMRQVCLETASSLHSQNYEGPLTAKLFHHWGLLYFDREQFDSSSLYLEKAMSNASDGSSDYLIGRIAIQWAKTLRRLGDHAKAIDLIREGIVRYSNYHGPTHTSVATGYNDLAINQKALGDLEGAGHSYNKALDIRAKLFGKRSNAYARILNNTALQFLDQGDLTTALRYARETIEIFEALPDPDIRFYIASHNTLAQVFSAMKRFDQAEDQYRKALKMFQRQYPGSSRVRYYLISLANNALDREKPNEALSYFHEAMYVTFDGIDPDDFSSNPARDDPSNYQSLKTLCTYKAKSWYASYLQSQDTTQLHAAMHLYDLADHFATKNRTESQYQRSRVAYSRQNLTLYQGAIETALQLWKGTHDKAFLEKAFLYSEKSKSLTLLEDLLEANALNNSGLPTELLEKEKRIQDSLAHIRTALLKSRGSKREAESVQNLQKEKLLLELSYENFKRHLEDSFPRFYQSKYDFDFESVASLQAGLGPDESVISFFVGRDKIFRFLVLSNEVTATTLEKSDSLSSWISNLRDHIRSYDPSLPISAEENQVGLAHYQRAAHHLFDLLLGDLKDQLKAKTSIIPDDVLNYIPFGALLTELPAEGVPFSKYPFLEKESVISYNYSGTLARQMRRQQAEKPRLLAIAPTFDGSTESDSRGTLTPLLFNQQEADAIEKIWSGSSLMGPLATKSAFKKAMHEYGIIHFATHALVNEGDAALSYLAFAPTPQQEPYLFLEELYDLDLPVQLITLSACETSLGPLQQGEGIASVAQGFSYAGAKSIITSLWDVDDGAAERIMIAFYQNLEEGMPKDQALQFAKLDYLRTAEDHLSHPFYWASFIPIGDMRQIDVPTDSTWFFIAGGVILILLAGFFINRFTK